MTAFAQRIARLFLFFVFVAVQVAGAEKPDTISVQGQTYVSLQDWSRARNFTYRWDKANKTFSTASKWTKLSFQISSKKAAFNDSTLWLTSPVLAGNDAVYIAQRDLDKSIHPILYPGRLARGKRIRTVVIAPGHGGKDPGYQINKDQEKKYTLLMGKALREALRASGLKVVLTREKDQFVELADQAKHANRIGADLFINLHYNAALETDANGVETYCLTPAGAISTNGGRPVPRSLGHRQDDFNPLLAYQIHDALTSKCAFEDRGIRRAAFQVLREIKMPGVLIEGGFLSNHKDAAKIKSSVQRTKVARAIADGILRYKQIVERK